MLFLDAQSRIAVGRRDGTSQRTKLALFAMAAAAGLLVLAYATAAGSSLAKFNDFYREALPAYHALAHGHVVGFLKVGPVYVGSLVLRAPVALVPSLWNAGPRAVYFASALPCVLAAAAFCSWLGAQPRLRGGVTPASRIAPVLCCLFNPLLVIALFGGHPEELLGAVLCVAAVILAARDRAGLAGLAVALAVVNKSWAAVAVPVVLAALPERRWRALLAMSVTWAVVLVPILAVRQGGFTTGGNGAGLGTIFNPPQLLWWFGAHSWIAQHARAEIVVLAAGFAGLWLIARRHFARPPGGLANALLLLALVLLIRAAFDPWNNLYYHLPFVLALLAYETSAGRMPRLTLAYTVLFLIVVPIGGAPHMSYDVRAAVYAATVVPTMAWMAARLVRPPGVLGPSVARRVRGSDVPVALSMADG